MLAVDTNVITRVSPEDPALAASALDHMDGGMDFADMPSHARHAGPDDRHAGGADSPLNRQGPPMFLEIAQIDIKPGQEAEFEAGVARAAPLFKRAKGCRAMSLQRYSQYRQGGKSRL
jgi:hypothetical protein